MRKSIGDILFRIKVKIRIAYQTWHLKMSIKKHGKLIPGDYKTIAEAIEAGEKYIVVLPEKK